MMSTSIQPTRRAGWLRHALALGLLVLLALYGSVLAGSAVALWFASANVSSAAQGHFTLAANLVGLLVGLAVASSLLWVRPVPRAAWPLRSAALFGICAPVALGLGQALYAAQSSPASAPIAYGEIAGPLLTFVLATLGYVWSSWFYVFPAAAAIGLIFGATGWLAATSLARLES